MPEIPKKQITNHVFKHIDLHLKKFNRLANVNTPVKLFPRNRKCFFERNQKPVSPNYSLGRRIPLSYSYIGTTNTHMKKLRNSKRKYSLVVWRKKGPS